MLRISILLKFVGFLLLASSVSITCLGKTEGESKPLPPTVLSITLDPLTGVPTVTWQKPNPNPLHPTPIGYIIHNKPFEGIGWLAVDTVGPNIFSYTDYQSSGLDNMVKYNVQSNGPSDPSEFGTDLGHGSIHLTAQYDSCYNRLNLNWNHYVGWGNRIDSYKIYIGEDQEDWNNFTLIGTVTGVQNFYFHPVESDKELYLYIKAKRRESDLISLSNLAYINTKISKRPSYFSIDSIFAGDMRTELRFRIDTTTEYEKFSVERWEQIDSITSIFSAKSLHTFSDPYQTTYFDTIDSWAARSRPFYYKIDAYDGCNRVKMVTNLINSITIRAFAKGLTTNLSWDSLYSPNNHPVHYTLYRVAFSHSTLPPEVIHISNNSADLKFTDNLSVFSGEGYLPQFCYFVEAKENVGIDYKRVSLSRTLCIEVTPDVIMPNAIDPMSKFEYMGKPRNILVPTISFDSQYKLTVYNRWGGIVFNGANKGWDGRLANGELVKEGAYVYRLEVYSESNRMVTKTGTVTVIYGPNQ